MEELPNNNKLLKFQPDTLEAVRAEYSMDRDKIINSIDLLEDWLKKQPHFVKKSYSRDYLERTLGTCKGSVERAKERIDKMCTFRTLMPEFFDFNNVKNDLEIIKEYVTAADVPMLTPDHIRVVIIRIEKDTFKSSYLIQMYKYFILICEYMKRFEYCAGFRIIVDCRLVNELNMVTRFNPMEFKKVMAIMIEGYGMRVAGINIISDSKLVESFVSLLKQVVSAKIAGRINVHNNLEDLYKVVDKTMLPEEYGGTEKPLQVLFDIWFDEITSEEHIQHAQQMSKAKTIESCRLDNQFNENYLGMPGSFRAMKID